MDLNQELNRTYGWTDKGNTICRVHYRGRDIENYSMPIINVDSRYLLPVAHGHHIYGYEFKKSNKTMTTNIIPERLQISFT